MIKFFRVIRKNLISKNKIGKYLLYAFGEIILVIIGILIALNLNQSREQQKMEAKIDAIFEDVLVDLAANINESTSIIYGYQQTDSLASLVLNTDLKYADYSDENSSDLWRVATSYSSYDITFKAYDVLMANIDAVPKKYDSSIANLRLLQSRFQHPMVQHNKKIEALVSKNLDDFEKNYSWYSDMDYKKSKAAIDFRLHDYRYKNMVKRAYGEAILTHRTYVTYYRTQAILCYKEIASVLNKPTDSLDFISNLSTLESYVGTYRDKFNPESEAIISLKEGILVLTVENNQVDKDFLINLNSDTDYAIVWRKGIVKFIKSDSEGNTNLTIHLGHTPVTYTKIEPQ